ncbi:hydroxyacid dehydrogenase [soil metagenome]
MNGFTPPDSTVKPFKLLLTSAIDPGVTSRLAEHCDVILAPDASPETIRRLAADADAMIVRNQLAADVFDHTPELKYCVRHGVGLDMIPMAAATAAGIIVTNLPGSNTTAVTEYCLAAMFHFRRGLSVSDARLREAGWAESRSLAGSALELRGSTLGIVGVGSIGTEVARIGTAMGMRAIGLTRRPQSLPDFVEAVDKPALFATADVIVLACPLTDETRGLVDAAALALVKPDAIVINVARGPVVDIEALMAALRQGRLRGAALDVHDRQPLAVDAAVFDCPNLLLTTHVAGTTAASLRNMSQGAMDTLLALMRGERPMNIVNPEVLTAPPGIE